MFQPDKRVLIYRRKRRKLYTAASTGPQTQLSCDGKFWITSPSLEGFLNGNTAICVTLELSPSWYSHWRPKYSQFLGFTTRGRRSIAWFCLWYGAVGGGSRRGPSTSSRRKQASIRRWWWYRTYRSKLLQVRFGISKLIWLWNWGCSDSSGVFESP